MHRDQRHFWIPGERKNLALYHEDNLFNTVKRIDFNITQTQFQSQIKVDRSGTPSRRW
jgi:hypothetical protein